MKFIIHEVLEDIHEELDIYGVAFEDSELVTILATEEDGSIKEVPRIGLTIYDIIERTVAVFPVEDDIYAYTADADLMRDTYASMINEYNIYKSVLSAFQEHVGKVMEPDVWIVTVEAIPLEDQEQPFPIKTGGKQTVRIRSYLIKKEMRGHAIDALRFDTYGVHTLCNNVIDIHYLLKSLKPTEKKSVLVTVFEKSNKVVAIRTTKLISRVRADVMGAYACSKGYGKLIQEWTENLIRARYTTLFSGLSAAARKPLTFRLSAVDTAVSFWEHVGFTRTGQVDKEGQAILEKPLYDMQPPITGKKRATSSDVSSKSQMRKR